jgi:deoxyribodipyrimidine photo-lyase
METTLAWFRRDLRCFDHAALHHALQASRKVFCAFIFDSDILDELPRADRRIEFIHASLAELAAELEALGGHLLVRYGRAGELIPGLAAEVGAAAVFANEDYEPAAIARDAAVAQTLAEAGRSLRTFKDQVIFSKDEVLSLAGKPFSVFTPYKNAWLRKLQADPSVLAPWHIEPLAERLASGASELLSLQQIGFETTDLRALGIPAGMSGGAAMIEVHLRFGTVSIRHLVRTVSELSARGQAGEGGAVWLSELIWREFYQMILFHNPHVVGASFKPVYDRIEWETGPDADAAFAAWCEGRTGYPLVDAAMAAAEPAGLHAQPPAHGDGLLPHQGPRHRLARGEAYFALRLNDFRPGGEQRRLAMGGIDRLRCTALLPHLQSGHAVGSLTQKGNSSAATCRSCVYLAIRRSTRHGCCRRKAGSGLSGSRTRRRARRRWSATT